MAWDKCAILIPTRNRPGILANTLSKLATIGLGNIDLWVYDDASDKPEEIQRVVARWRRHRLMRGERRVGQAEGRNVLMRTCGKEIALLLDDDSYPSAAAPLQEAINAFSGPEPLAVITFQCKSMADGKLATPPSIPRSYCLFFLGGGSLLHIPSVLGAGGFRSQFIYGYEEPELAFRLWARGFKMIYDPTVTINHNHFESADEQRDYREYDYLYARNGILTSSLNMPIWFGLPHGLLRSLRRSLYCSRNFPSKLKGTMAGLYLSWALWKQRQPVDLLRVLEWIKLPMRS